jgi:hypothetical protein
MSETQSIRRARLSRSRGLPGTCRHDAAGHATHVQAPSGVWFDVSRNDRPGRCTLFRYGWDEETEACVLLGVEEREIGPEETETAAP